jgi:beta-glucosidase
MQSENDKSVINFTEAADRVRHGAPARTVAKQLYEQLTDDEKLNLLEGDEPFWPGMLSFVSDGYNFNPYVMGEVKRLGIPGIRFIDGPRGCVRGKATAFPVSMARGATWDTNLEERVGIAIGEEIREEGGNFFGGVCINLPRHPAWGRVQETYSDQPILLGKMGAALVKGVQHNAMACMKHFSCNSMENARFSVNVHVDEATYHEVYLPHFKHVADSGVAAVMTSYNSVNGQWAGQNAYNLTKVLREDWGFDGMAVSDFIWGLRDAAASLTAGLDVEEPFSQQRGAHLRESLESGTASWSDVRRSGIRILETQLRYYAQRWTEEPKGTIASAAHAALAREVESRAVVVLKNETVDSAPALPLSGALSQVAVIGRLADIANTGDHGSSDVHSPYVVTPLEGIREALPHTNVEYAVGDDVAAASKLAYRSDAAIVVVGYTASDEGEFVDGSIADREDLLKLYPEPQNAEEAAMRDKVLASMGSGQSVVGSETSGGDRRDLHLHSSDVELIHKVAAANERTIVVVVSAGAVLMEEWSNDPSAIVLAWYSGMEGGHGLADVLTGKCNPSGRLPYPIPVSEADLPPLDIDATSIVYDRWYGQRLIQKNGSQALFPLGYGLSYTSWSIEQMHVRTVDLVRGSIVCEVSVSNNGQMGGHHVVQLYGTYQEGPRKGERELLGFAALEVAAGGSATCLVEGDLSAIGHWDPETRTIRTPAGTVLIEASSFWGDPTSVSAEVIL